jgi:formylglycine-generating enzyme
VRERRPFTNLCLLCAVSGCEVLAGLRGERQVAPLVGVAGEAPGEQSPGVGGTPCSTDADGCAGSQATSSVASQGGARHQQTAPGGASADGGTDVDSAGNGNTGGIAVLVAGGGAGGEAGFAEAGAAGSEPVGIPLASPSCAGTVPTECGPVNPCLTLQVKGGSFELGRNEDGTRADYFPTGSANEVPEHRVTVGGYWLDRYEVTVGRFRRFVDAYDGTPPSAGAGLGANQPASGWSPDWNHLLPPSAEALRARLVPANPSDNTVVATWTDAPGANECRPINDLDWALAFAFCIWDGGRLPTDAEWEFAAAGGDQERRFPWGSGPPDGRAVFGCSFAGTLSCTTNDLPRIGSMSPAGDGRFGHVDLAGSVSEPTRDAYDPNFYSIPQAAGSNVVNLGFYGSYPDIPLRGGGYDSTATDLRGVVRKNSVIVNWSSQVGVRCARDQ